MRQVMRVVRPIPLSEPVPLGACVSVNGDPGWRLMGVWAHRSGDVPTHLAGIFNLPLGLLQPTPQVLLTLVKDDTW